MGSPYEVFRTEKEFEEKGVIIDYGDFRVRIARAGGANKKFAKILNVRMKPYKRQMDTDTMDEGVATNIMIGAYADAIILGWESRDKDGKWTEGIQFEDGEIEDYNRENVVKILSDLPDLFKDLQSQANSVAIFRAKEIEEVSKNSSAV